MKSPAAYITLLATCLLMATSCDEGCLNNKNSLPKAGFYSAATGEAVAVSDLTVSGIGAPGDSTLLHNETSSEVYLPFRAMHQSVSYRFSVMPQPDYTLSDTISFEYTSTPYFVNDDCGAMYRYRITGVRWQGTLIDSVAVTDSLITNVDAERIKIYFYGSAD